MYNVSINLVGGCQMGWMLRILLWMVSKDALYVIGAMVNVVANNVLYYLMILGSNTKWIWIESWNNTIIRC